MNDATFDETNRDLHRAGPGKRTEPETPAGQTSETPAWHGPQDPAFLTAASVVRLQGFAGNQAVAGLVVAGAGRPPAVGIQRAPAAELTETAEAADQEQRQNTERPPAMRISMVSDISAASDLVRKLMEWRPLLQEGSEASGAFVTSANRVTPDKMGANEEAIANLDDYLVMAGEQTRTLGSFKGSLQQTRVNFARLKSQVSLLASKKKISGEEEGMGKEIVHAAGLGDPGSSQQRMQKLELNPAMAGIHMQVQDAHKEMQGLSKQVGQKQYAASQAVYAYHGALNDFKGGLPTVEDNPDQAKALREVKDEIETVKKYVGKGLELAGKGLEAAGVPGAGTVGEKASIVSDYLTDQFYDAKLNGIKTKLAQFHEAHLQHKIFASLDIVREKSVAFTAAITDYNNTVEDYGQAQKTFRDKLSQLGRSADGGHGDHFAQVAAVLAEVDTFETQIDATLRLAYQEQAAASKAGGARQNLEGGGSKPEGGRQAATKYYSPYKWFHNNGGWAYECMENEIHLGTYGSRGSAEGDVNVGVNATIEKGIDDLKWSREQVDPMRQALAKALDLRMEGAAPTSAGATEVTSKSEKTGL